MGISFVSGKINFMSEKKIKKKFLLLYCMLCVLRDFVLLLENIIL